jgi:hypothetical protein
MEPLIKNSCGQLDATRAYLTWLEEQAGDLEELSDKAPILPSPEPELLGHVEDTNHLKAEMAVSEQDLARVQPFQEVWIFAAGDARCVGRFLRAIDSHKDGLQNRPAVTGSENGTSLGT